MTRGWRGTDLLKGDERRKKVGRKMFDKERGLCRMRKLSEMDMHKPFAAQYNAEMHKAMKVEGKLMEAEIQLMAATQAANQQEATMAEARQSVLHDQLVVLEDRVQFIFECSQLAAQPQCSSRTVSFACGCSTCFEDSLGFQRTGRRWSAQTANKMAL